MPVSKTTHHFHFHSLFRQCHQDSQRQGCRRMELGSSPGMESHPLLRDILRALNLPHTQKGHLLIQKKNINASYLIILQTLTITVASGSVQIHCFVAPAGSSIQTNITTNSIGIQVTDFTRIGCSNAMTYKEEQIVAIVLDSPLP